MSGEKNNLDFLIRNCTTSSAHFLFSKSSHSQLCCGFENKKSTEPVAHLRQKLSKLFLAESLITGNEVKITKSDMQYALYFFNALAIFFYPDSVQKNSKKISANYLKRQ